MNKTLYWGGITGMWMIAISLIGYPTPVPEEGMYPLPALQKLDLQKAGLKLNTEDIFKPEGVGLTDALVRVGGCTGSFVSPEGLVITNHHCAFGAAQAASSTDNDYMTDGFLARRKEDEQPAKGIVIKITQSYSEVSDQILEGLTPETDPGLRMQTITERIRNIEKSENESHPGLSCEVSEMFAGRSYFLFRYQLIKDVRMVYVPPRNIGEFGGDKDNWEWPRHNGDFAFLRAYVNKEGQPAPYSPENVPYQPKRFLKINPSGVKEGDFVFVMGYPGRTFRHQPARFLAFQEKYQLPYISHLYAEQIETMKRLSQSDKTLAISVADRIKSLANVSKNYAGKLEGFHKLNLTNQRRAEETEMQQFILNTPELSNKYGNVLSQFDTQYQELDSIALRNLWLGQIYNAAEGLSAALFILQSREKILSLSGEEKEKELKQAKLKLKVLLSDMDARVDKALFEIMIRDAQKLLPWQRIVAVDDFFQKEKNQEQRMQKIDAMWAKSKVFQPIQAYEILEMPEKYFKKLKDPVLTFVSQVRKQQQAIASRQQYISGTLNRLAAQYVEMKSAWKPGSFTPDANATLRLTYGYVKGYSIQDAVIYEPKTWLSGMIEKATLGGEYQLYPALLTAFKNRSFGKWTAGGRQDVPLAILYNTDTSGGNSGSPVMNAYGELVAINFDRTYSATINDYAWNDQYSRSIGVDIRFVLWVTEQVAGAGFLLKEMGV